jgi:sec-independent protein translocase protein TatC
MSNGRLSTHVDPEDMFAETRMSFGDHLEELRTHLWRAIKGFVLAMIVALCFGNYVVQFITAPVEDQLHRFYERAARKRSRALLEKADQGAYVRSTHVQVELSRNAIREAIGLPPLPAPVLGPTIHAFETLLDDLDVMEFVDPKDRLEDSSRIKVNMAIRDPRFYAVLTRVAVEEGRPQRMSTMNVTEAFMVYFKVSLVTGLVIGSPWIFYQIWMFVAAGLYPHEKRLVNVYLPFSLALFLAGAAICQFLVMPKAIEVLLSFNEWMGLEPDLRLNEWLSFALWLPVIFGISFQTPLVMHFLFKIGIADVSTFRGYRKIAWFLMAVFAAVITPTPDAMTMLYLWVPMGLLYELGILMCAMQPRTPFEEVETPETEEMVEV